MDTARLNGKTYVKAAKAARDAGYTPDYVGQLCRQGKIDAVTLGKAWYVREGAVAEHKQSARRSNAGTTRRELERQMEEMVVQRNKAPVSYPRAPRTHILETPVQYSHDTADLLPTPIRTRAETHEPQSTAISTTDDLHRGVEDQLEHQKLENTLTLSRFTNDSEGAPKLSEQEDTPQEESVPIRRLNTAGPRRSPSRQTVRKKPVVQEYVKNKPLLSPFPLVEPETEQAALKSETSEQHGRAIQIRRSLLPMVVTTALVFVVLTFGIFLQATWTYTEVAGESTVQTTYGFASVGSVLEEFQKGDE